MDNLLLHLILFLSILPLFVVRYRRNQLNFIVSAFMAIVGAVGFALTSAGIGFGVATAIAYGVAIGTYACIFGGIALSVTLGAKTSMGAGGDYSVSSPSYSQTKQTQTNPDLPIPLLYGTVKVAGNRVWQDDNYRDSIKRIVAFSDGEVEDFTDIRLNDIPIGDIRGATVQKFYGTSAQGLPTGLPSGVGLDQLGSLKYVAYLYIKTPKTDKVDINYNLTTVVKGRKIRVYTTPTTYTYKYSENPAWVMFDFLTAYNGRGLCLKDDGTIDEDEVAKLFDMNSFIESANYCDQEITYTDKDGNVKTTKRFTFNMIFDSQTSHKTLLDEIQRSCRGGLFTKEGKLQFKIDKAEVVSKVFNESDILDGSETFQTLPNEENYEVLKIDYVSPEHEWQRVQAYAEVPMTRTGVPIEHTVNCFSVTNFQQASRLAWYYLNSKRLCPYFGSFKTGFKAWDLEVGQVIEIPVILMGLENYKVKVTSVINNGTGTYTVNYRTYDERLYNDDLGCKEPTVLVTKLSDQYGFPKDVENFNVVQNNNLFSFVWQATNETDVYEIRYGNDWETGEVIGKNIPLNSFSYPIKKTGLYKFFIKAKNQYNYSVNSTLDVINITDVPEQNVIVAYDVINEAYGTFYNTKKYKKTIKLSNNVLWHTTADKWGEGDTYYQTGDKWGASVYSQGYYVSQVYDLGGVLNCDINFETNFTSFDADASIVVEWRYSEDNITWSDWQVANLGAYTFRYAQFKVTFISPNNLQVVLQKLNVIIDVPDKFEYLDVDVDNVSGIYVNYDFYDVPSIVATVNEDITAYAVISEKTNKQAKVMVYNNNGVATTGNVSLYLKGY